MSTLALIVLALNLGVLALVTWNCVAWPKVRRRSECRGSVSILIPARNEERRLPECLESAMRQGPAVTEILVYDDHSTDGTRAVVEACAAQDPRVRLIECEPLPADWFGKPFACSRLAAHAHGTWLLFIDADARLAHDGAASLASEAEAWNVTFLSGWPALELRTFAESLCMPLLNFCVLTLFPAPLSLRRRDPSLGLAHGACILADRLTYSEVGGHGSVRREIFEDTALARHWRTAGHRGICLDGQDAVRVRMYESLGEIWAGFRKVVFPAFRRPVSFWVFLSAHTLLFMVPFIGAPFSREMIAAALCVWATRGVLAARFHQPFLSVFLHPIAEILLLGLSIDSWQRCHSGRGVEWKGRLYRASLGKGEDCP